MKSALLGGRRVAWPAVSVGVIIAAASGFGLIAHDLWLGLGVAGFGAILSFLQCRPAAVTAPADGIGAAVPVDTSGVTRLSTVDQGQSTQAAAMTALGDYGPLAHAVVCGFPFAVLDRQGAIEYLNVDAQRLFELDSAARNVHFTDLFVESEFRNAECLLTQALASRARVRRGMMFRTKAGHEGAVVLGLRAS
jgi:hypothetical protein